MISSLKGTVVSITPLGGLTLQLGPLGLDVLVPKSLLARISVSAQLTLFTHLQVSDDALTLFGFGSESDRAFFRQLLTVTGVGPKSALAILAIQPDEVRAAVLNKDLNTLERVPGLGRKRAQRLILELANVLTDEPEAPARKKTAAAVHPLEDSVMPALIKLGYEKAEIKRMLAEVPADIEAPENVLQYILKHAR